MNANNIISSHFYSIITAYYDINSDIVVNYIDLKEKLKLGSRWIKTFFWKHNGISIWVD